MTVMVPSILNQKILAAQARGHVLIYACPEYAIMEVPAARINHVLHALLGLFTLGLWWFVWLLIVIFSNFNPWRYTLYA
jgi:hypothetical protein